MQQAFALRRPGPGWWAWVTDLHVVLVLVAAVPVWVLLGAMAHDDMRLPVSTLDWALLVFVQPLAEELVFRGLLQGQLLRWTSARRVGSVSAANLLTTIGFVVAHLFSQPAAWALSIAAPSLVLGHLRERFGSVLPAMVVHAIFNAGFALVGCGMSR